MDNFERCLEDIEAALQFGYPHNMRFKLLDRQENIFNTNKITKTIRNTRIITSIKLKFSF